MRYGKIDQTKILMGTAKNLPEDLTRVHKAIKKKFQNKKLIFGDGNLNAKVVFVSEIPGPEEERESRPLAGLSAKFLNQLLKSAGIDKKKIYVTNVVKYFPSSGKMPTSKEIKSHALFLKEELKSIHPQVVVTLGNIALNGVGMRQPLDNVHGRVFNLGSYELLPTFHPGHALQNAEVKILCQKDFIKLKELLNKPVPTETN